MFIRLKNMTSLRELNVNITKIISFEPANDGGNSKIILTDGSNYIVQQSNRTLRHACKKAHNPASAEPIPE